MIGLGRFWGTKGLDPVGVFYITMPPCVVESVLVLYPYPGFCNTWHVNIVFYRCDKVTTQKCLRVFKMPHIFILDCKGAGYVVPSKELKIADVSSSCIYCSRCEVAHRTNIFTVVGFKCIQVLTESKTKHQYLVGNVLPGQFYCLHSFQWGESD